MGGVLVRVSSTQFLCGDFPIPLLPVVAYFLPPETHAMHTARVLGPSEDRGPRTGVVVFVDPDPVVQR